MKPTRGKKLTAFLALLWLTITVSSYYLTHKPFSTDLALNIIVVLLNLFVGLSITALAGGIGMRLLPKLDLDPLTRLFLRAALGMGVEALSFLVIGSTIGINEWTGWGLLLALGIVFRREVILWGRDWRSLAKAWNEVGKLGRLIAILSSLILLSSLFVVLAPPLKFDSLVYHLALPRAYLEVGRITFIPGNMYWGFPQLPQMLYTWAFSLGMGYPALIGWIMGVLTLVGILGYVSQRMSPRYAWMAVATLLGSYSLALSLGWGYVDWPSMLMSLAFIVAIDSWMIHAERKYLWLAGIFAGLTFSTKYTAGIIFLSGIAVLLWYQWKNKNNLRKELLVFSSAAAIFAFPWLFKNFIFTGNPIYPFIFTSGEITQIRLNFYQGQPVEGNWLDLFFLPIRATFWGVEVAHVGDGPGYDSSIGPLFLALGSLAWINLRKFDSSRRNLVRNAGLISFISVVIWALGGRISGHLLRTHLYYSIFPALAILAAAGFAGLERISISGIRLGRLAGVFVIMVLGLNVLQVGVNTLKIGAPQFLINSISEEEYLNNNLGILNTTMQALNELTEDSLVLMLWEPRSYYCVPRCQPDEVLDAWVNYIHSTPDISELVADWRDLGFTHLLYFRFGANFVREEDARYQSSEWEALEELLSGLTLHTDFANAYQLYSLNP
ncbi:MAG: hypothetical protein FVQ83_07985 [Chloroflexi bacterium]|nr:hypothetical protein [Chloroflexota bacterium]